MPPHPTQLPPEPARFSAPLWLGRTLVGAVLAWIVWRIWAGLFIPWWFNTDELVFYYEVLRQLRLDPSQTFFDIPGTPFMTLTSGLTAGWWVLERALSLTQTANAADFAFEHVQGVYTLMRAITLSCYVAAMGLSFHIFRRAAGLMTGVIATLLTASLPIHVHYSHFVRTESLGLFLCLLAILILIHPRTARYWATYLGAGLLCGMAMGARFHFGLVGLPVALAIYFLQDRPQLHLTSLPHVPPLERVAAALAGLFILGGIIALLVTRGLLPSNQLTHTMLLTTTAGPAQYAGAKAAVAKLWLLLGTGSLGTLLWYYLPTARDRTKVINSFTLALGVGFAGGFLLAHPTFLWRGEHQLRSIQFYADWVDPNLTKLSTVESWWQVTHYYFTTALPEKWLQYAFFLGVGTILWSRQPLALAFLFGAMICFIAHSVTMKLWPHHIVPWLPLLCFVAAHPLGLLFSLVTQKFRSRLSALTAVALALGLPLAALPPRLAKADEYLTISRGRTTQIEAMNRWLSSQVPADAFLAIGYYALSSDGFMKWIESVGLTIPAAHLQFPHTQIWWLQRSTLDGQAGYVCLSRADILFFREDAERKNPGSTYDPFTDQRFEALATFGAGVYELKVFKFDLRDPTSRTLADAKTPPRQEPVTPQSRSSPAASMAVNSTPVPSSPANGQASVNFRRLPTGPEPAQTEIKQLQQQLKTLAASADEQRAYIQALEKETARLQTVATATQQQLAAVSATSQAQLTYISALEKERANLPSRMKTQSEDIAHYVKVINEQTAYIKQLEALRPAAKK